MAHEHVMYDSDPHFTIDPDTRELKYASPDKLAIMQGDHNSEIITFDLPRFIDGHDMNLCDLVQIHYINIDATFTSTYITGIYEVTDKQLSKDKDGNDIVVFSWTISSNATSLIGPLNFAVRFCCTADSMITYSWHTAIYKQLSVSTGINNSEEFVDQHIDTLMEWYDKLFGSYDSYEERLQAVEEALENGVANTPSEASNALIATASGKAIRVDDVSPIEHKVKAKVSGKNLINVYEMTNSSLIFEDDGSYTLTKAGSSRLSLPVRITIPAGSVHTLSASLIEGTATKIYAQFYMSDGTTKSYALTSEVTSVSMLFADTVYQVRLYISNEESDGSYIHFNQLQIENGKTPTQYEPYLYPTTVNIARHGKNLLDVTKSALITVGSSGSKRYGIVFDKVGTYTFSCIAPGGIAVKIITDGEYGTYTTLVDNVSYTFTLAENQQLIIYQGSEGVLFDNRLTRAQIELGDTVTPYEPYFVEYYGSEIDGTFEIASVSPTMTIVTDNVIANLEIEYQQDANVFAEDVKSDIQELDRLTAEHTTLFGDIETALDAIIAIQDALIPKPDTFTFTVSNYSSNETFTLETVNGMTWGEWVDSKYNTMGAYIEYGVVCVNGAFLYEGLNQIYPTDIIDATKSYYFS